MDKLGHISKMGDTSVRAALYEAAIVLLTVSKSPSRLRSWGPHLRKQKGIKCAAVAIAKLAIVMRQSA